MPKRRRRKETFAGLRWYLQNNTEHLAQRRALDAIWKEVDEAVRSGKYIAVTTSPQPDGLSDHSQNHGVEL